MKDKLSPVSVGILTIALATATPAGAANKEHQQLMADIRMLQEQSQLLQNLLGQLNDALKAVNTRLDQQTEANRKAMADQKLVIDNLSNDVRVIREKLDDSNVRIGSLSQEVDALRQSMQQLSSRPSPTVEPDTGAGGPPPAGGSAPPAAGAASPIITASPKQMWEAAYADYTAGQYDLAILGFEAFIKSFPKSDLADDAQVTICNAYLNDGKYDKAVDACDLTIRMYPGSNSIPQAYYRKGLALKNLKNVGGAREAWDFLVKNFPVSAEASLATQGLEQLKKPE
jgi:TolA-binding protein